MVEGPDHAAEPGGGTPWLVKLIEERKTFSKPTAGTQLRVVFKRSRRQKQTIASQSKEIRRLRKALRASRVRKEAPESRAVRFRSVRETLSGVDTDLRRTLWRSRRQKATIKSLSRENARLHRITKGWRNRIEVLEAEIARLRSTGSVLSRRLYGRKTEQQKKPGTGRKRDQQRGAPGHGRTRRPGLEERTEPLAPPPDACVCARCGQPYAPNGVDRETALAITSTEFAGQPMSATSPWETPRLRSQYAQNRFSDGATIWLPDKERMPISTVACRRGHDAS